ncbi:MAG TPA: hypothetical protein ENG34_00350 [Candidatus Aenigmarchaeota archaeon]|nr:hypothetical protein [Candidatus Aenigmarchaeota archaeon]
MDRYRRKDDGIWKKIKEYNGIVPIAGGLLTSGVAGVVAFTVGGIQGASDAINYFYKTRDLVGAITTVYSRASSLAGMYVPPAFIGGQFVTYKFKKAFDNFLRWIWKGE